MKRLQLLSTTFGLFWIASLAAQEKPKSKVEEVQARDAAVLEVVLIDLLTDPDSPVEPRNEKKKEISFSGEALSYEIKSADVLRLSDEKKLEKLSKDQLAKTREAAEHLTLRLQKKDVFKEFVAKDKRIVLVSEGQAEKNKVEANRGSQVFHAFSPGFSRDQELAVVRVSFTWSGGFHGAAGVYVLHKTQDGWKVLLRDLIFYV